MTVTFRPIHPDDEDFLYTVYASTREDELAPLGWDEAQKTAFLQMQFAAQHRYYQEHYSNTTFQVILQDGHPIGRLYVGRWENEIRLVDLAMLPAYRGGGIGSGIVRNLLAEAVAAGKPVRLHVERLNPARRLYERLGFVRIADKGVYDLMEWCPRSDPPQVNTAS